MANQQSQNQGQSGTSKNFGAGATSTQADRSSQQNRPGQQQQGKNMEYSSEEDMGASQKHMQGQKPAQAGQAGFNKQSNMGSQESSQHPGKTGMDQPDKSGLEKPGMNSTRPKDQMNKQGQNKI